VWLRRRSHSRRPGRLLALRLKTPSNTQKQSALCLPMAAQRRVIAFSRGVDYELRPDGQPCAGCRGYFAGRRLDRPCQLPPRGRSAHATTVGRRVLRTLAESVALEIARLYAQLDAVYDAAFIDTTGSALDKVVALLGILASRQSRQHRMRFTRAPAPREASRSPPAAVLSMRAVRVRHHRHGTWGRTRTSSPYCE
jgi:hypothetical protein